MAVIPVADNAIITQADIEAMHEAVRSVVNASPSTNLSRQSLGSQHLKGILGDDAKWAAEIASGTGGNDYGDRLERTATFTTTVSVTFPESAVVMAAATGGGLGYATVDSLTGYTLTPCKVLVYASYKYTYLEPDNPGVDEVDERHQAWGVICTAVNGGALLANPIDSGVVFPPENRPNGGVSPAHDDNNYINHRMTIWTVIDMSADPGPSWTLDAIRFRAAMCVGNSANVVPAELRITHGCLGFVALLERA